LYCCEFSTGTRVPFEINTGTWAAVYHISDTPTAFTLLCFDCYVQLHQGLQSYLGLTDESFSYFKQKLV